MKKLWTAFTGDFVVLQRKLSGSMAGHSHRSNRIKDEWDREKRTDDTYTCAQSVSSVINGKVDHLNETQHNAVQLDFSSICLRLNTEAKDPC